MKRLNFRDATPADWPAIEAIHKRQQEEQGTNYEPPPFRGRTIPVALVGESDSGEIVGCLYVETVCELRFCATDPRFTAQARREVHGLAYILKLYGFRYLECFVPRKLKRYIERPLRSAGFESKDRELSYFSKDLRDR